MTILSRNKCIVQTRGQFRDRFDVDDTEIFDVLRDDHGEWLLAEVNSTRRYNNEEPFDSVDELIEQVADIHTDLRNELVAEIVSRHSLKQTIIDVLDDRDGGYIHLYGGTVHTIVEPHDEQPD
jgi:hypothetical protein